MDKVIPFPQADDFEKIITLLNIDNEADLKDNDRLVELLGDISLRQINYYLSACVYLGLLDDKRHFTSDAYNLRTYSLKQQEIELSRRIVSDKVFGTVFFTEKLLGFKMPKEDIIDIMKENIILNSEEMYNRRAQTVMKWVEWINSKIEQ